MHITLQDIEKAFEEIIAEKRTRESVALWASDLIKDDDLNQLDYIPSEQEPKIWEALSYLSGVDLKISPTSYLHGIEDFEVYLNEWRLKKPSGF